MSTYTGINIGPIVDTLSLTKRPRELWSASYLFSYLMQCIISNIPVNDNTKIISPALLSDKNDSTVGLYPDRIFIEGIINANEIIESALKVFAASIDIEYELVKKYFNVMSISINESSENSAIQTLNHYLDFAELDNRSIDENGMNSVLTLIRKKYNSKLFDIAFKDKKFNISSLSEIATYSLSSTQSDDQWSQICKNAKLEEKVNADIPERYRIPDEDFFYKEIKKAFKKEYKSYHKYICIVQADGDNMGKVVSHPMNNEVSELSKSLLDFGTAACKSIRDFGGLPIYAGGDDLLFIAPVISKNRRNIFDLLSDIDSCYKTIQDKVVTLHLSNDEDVITTSMSYGLSVTYYKFPLYEALSSARDLLFGEAKHLDKKDAIAWKLQKHSGSTFCGSLSKSRPIFQAFNEVIRNTADEKMVAAVAHKIRSNNSLLSLLIDKDDAQIEKRLDAFFDKVIDIGEKSASSIIYLNSIKSLLIIFYRELREKTIKKKDGTSESDKQIIRKVKTDQLVLNIYGMLRTAKFIKGEEDENE